MKTTLFCTALIACASIYTSAEALTITNHTDREIYFYAYGAHAEGIKANASKDLSDETIRDALKAGKHNAGKDRTFHMGVQVNRYPDASPEQRYLTTCGQLYDVNKDSNTKELAKEVADLTYEVTFDGNWGDPNANLTCTVKK